MCMTPSAGRTERALRAVAGGVRWVRMLMAASGPDYSSLDAWLTAQPNALPTQSSTCTSV